MLEGKEYKFNSILEDIKERRMIDTFFDSSSILKYKNIFKTGIIAVLKMFKWNALCIECEQFA